MCEPLKGAKALRAATLASTQVIRSSAYASLRCARTVTRTNPLDDRLRLRVENAARLAFAVPQTETMVRRRSDSPLVMLERLTEGSPSDTPGVVKLRMPPRQ